MFDGLPFVAGNFARFGITIATGAITFARKLVVKGLGTSTGVAFQVENSAGLVGAQIRDNGTTIFGDGTGGSVQGQVTVSRTINGVTDPISSTHAFGDNSLATAVGSGALAYGSYDSSPTINSDTGEWDHFQGYQFRGIKLGAAVLDRMVGHTVTMKNQGTGSVEEANGFSMTDMGTAGSTGPVATQNGLWIDALGYGHTDNLAINSTSPNKHFFGASVQIGDNTATYSIASGTYDSATGRTVIQTNKWMGDVITSGLSVVVQNLTGTGAFASLNGTFTSGTGTGSIAVTGASWSGGVATVTVASAHAVAVGDFFTLASIVPSGYTGTYQAVTGTTGSTLKYALTPDPGAYSSGGNLAQRKTLVFTASSGLGAATITGGNLVFSIVNRLGLGKIPTRTIDANALTNGEIRLVNLDNSTATITLSNTGSGSGVIAVAAGALTVSTSSTVRLTVASAGNIGIAGATSPSFSLSLGGAAARTIGMERTTGTNGQGLTVNAGGAVSGGTDRNGGTLTLASGVSTGTGTGSIFLQTPATGTTGTSDNALSTRLAIIAGGNIGVGTTAPTAKFDVNSNILRLRTAKTPSSAADTGNAGDICWDSGFLYVCIASNTWQRVAHATW